jgi:hypothetical protein
MFYEIIYWKYLIKFTFHYVITDQLMPLVLLLIITKYTLGFGQKFILSNSALLIEASSKRGKNTFFELLEKKTKSTTTFWSFRRS